MNACYSFSVVPQHHSTSACRYSNFSGKKGTQTCDSMIPCSRIALPSAEERTAFSTCGTSWHYRTFFDIETAFLQSSDSEMCLQAARASLRHS